MPLDGRSPKPCMFCADHLRMSTFPADPQPSHALPPPAPQVRAEQEIAKRSGGGGESDEEEAPALAKPVALPSAPVAQPVSGMAVGVKLQVVR